MDAELEVFFDVFRLRRETRSFIPFGDFPVSKKLWYLSERRGMHQDSDETGHGNVFNPRRIYSS